MTFKPSVKWIVSAVIAALVLIFFWGPTMDWFLAVFAKAKGLFGK